VWWCGGVVVPFRCQESSLWIYVCSLPLTFTLTSTLTSTLTTNFHLLQVFSLNPCCTPDGSCCNTFFFFFFFFDFSQARVTSCSDKGKEQKEEVCGGSPNLNHMYVPSCLCTLGLGTLFCIFCLISCLSYLVSHILSLISCLSSLISRLSSHLSSLISHLSSPVSRLPSPVSRLSSLTPHLSSHLSSLFSITSLLHFFPSIHVLDNT
jgi:hypothetical protein